MKTNQEIMESIDKKASQYNKKKHKNRIISLSVASCLVVCISLGVALPLTLNDKIKFNTGVSTGLEYVMLDNDTYAVSIGSAKDKNIGIPDEKDGTPVTKIIEHGFENSNIISVVIPDSVLQVGDYAFQNCKKLKGVKYRSSVAKKHTGASTASVFDEIETDEADGYFGYGAFMNCSELTNITIPDGIVTIGSRCLMDAAALTKVVMPDTVKYVYGAAFEGCENIEEFVFSKNTEAIGMGAFHNTKWLDQQEDGPIYIGKCLYAYKGETPEVIDVRYGTVEISTEFCSDYYPSLTFGITNLTTLNCNSDLERICSKAFQGCLNLAIVNFNGSKPEIEYMAFWGTLYGKDLYDNYPPDYFK